MQTIIKQLENRLNETEGLSIIDTIRTPDDFTYMVAVKNGEDTFVVYTTRGIQHYMKESCFLAIQVTEHIPFNSVAATVNGDLVTPYKNVIRNKGVQVGQAWYGLNTNELPFFQKAS